MMNPRPIYKGTIESGLGFGKFNRCQIKYVGSCGYNYL